MNLDELMDGKAPGEIRIVFPFRAGWFRPFYRDEYNNWHGLSHLGKSEIIESVVDCEIYTEPKPTKKVFEWMYFDEYYWHIRGTLMTEAEAEKSICGLYKKTGREFEVEA